MLLLVSGFFFIITNSALAQAPGFDDNVPDEVPLDGGVSTLIVAGVGYSIKKIADNTKRRKAGMDL